MKIKINRELKEKDLDNILYEETNKIIARFDKMGVTENVYGKTLVEIKSILGDYQTVECKIDSKYDLIKAIKEAINEKENTEKGSYAYQMGEWALYSNRNRELAISCYMMGIRKSNKDSYFRLGTIFKTIEGYSEKSKIYLDNALRLGSREMQYKMGEDYEEGNDVKQDLKQALELYKKSAAQGHGKAQFKLGYMYENGLGIKQNYTEAAKWYTRCIKTIEQHYRVRDRWPMGKSDFHYTKVYYRLGQLFEKGLGVEQDYLKAIELYGVIAWPIFPWQRDEFADEIEKRIVEIVKNNNVDFDYEKEIKLFEKKYKNPFPWRG